jgi:transcription antitermination factor NusG
MIEPSTLKFEPSVISHDPVKAIHLQPHWYAVYTCANHERSVSDQLVSRGVEHFLPQYESVRRWKDRKMRLRLPLFPGYVFVYLALQNRLRVLQVPGVVRLVGFDGHPVAVPQEEVARVRQFLNEGFQVEPHRYLQAGRRVRVKTGPLAGIEGIFVRARKKCRIVVSMDLIMRSIAVEVDLADVESVH